MGLLIIGANPNIANEYHTTPLHIVTFTKPVDAGVLLLADGAKVTREKSGAFGLPAGTSARARTRPACRTC